MPAWVYINRNKQLEKIVYKLKTNQELEDKEKEIVERIIKKLKDI